MDMARSGAALRKATLTAAMNLPRPGLPAATYLSLVAAHIAAAFLASALGCRRPQGQEMILSAQDSVTIIEGIRAHRAALDSMFRFDPDSPFLRDSTIHYEGIRWFPPDLHYYFRLRLFRASSPETVTVMGTKGEQRTQLKEGYFIIPFDGREYRLNAYKMPLEDSRRYGISPNTLSVWFTDSTTGRETYEVGRYVDVGEEQPDLDHVYTIDLNDAYNPYCAYSALYSCAVPRKEDHFEFAVRAGELKYHP